MTNHITTTEAIRAEYATRARKIERATVNALRRGQYFRAAKLCIIHGITTLQCARMEKAINNAEYFINH